jgi:hypothetical protein
LLKLLFEFSYSGLFIEENSGMKDAKAAKWNTVDTTIDIGSESRVSFRVILDYADS